MEGEEGSVGKRDTPITQWLRPHLHRVAGNRQRVGSLAETFPGYDE